METDHTVHIGLGPDDVMIMVDDHWPAENVKVLHNIFLDVSERGDVCVVTCRIHKNIVHRKIKCFSSLPFDITLKAMDSFIRLQNVLYSKNTISKNKNQLEMCI